MYLIPHASHILQPLDLACFGPLKRKYREILATDALQDDYHPMKQQNFINHYRTARAKAIRPTLCASGFEAAGIDPWDPAKAATSPYVLHKTFQTSLPPSTVVSKPKIKPWDYTDTPSCGKQVVMAISMTNTTISTDRVVRTVLAKSGKKIDRLLFDNAELQRENSMLRRQLGVYKAKRTRKQPVNPNIKFISQHDIQMGSHGPAVPILPTNQSIDGPIVHSAPQNDRPDVTTAFQAAIAQLRAGSSTVRST